MKTEKTSHMTSRRQNFYRKKIIELLVKNSNCMKDLDMLKQLVEAHQNLDGWDYLAISGTMQQQGLLEEMVIDYPDSSFIRYFKLTDKVLSTL